MTPPDTVDAPGDPGPECARARAAAGALEIPAPVLLRATGADRVSFLHRLLTCDVEGLEAGAGTRGLLLTAKGKVAAVLVLFVLPDRVEVIAPAAARPALLAGLSKFIIADDVTLEDRGGAAGIVSLVGPRAGEAAARVLGGPIPVPRRTAGHGTAGHGTGAADGETSLATGERPVTVFRRPRAGLPAVDLMAAAEDLPVVRAAALAAAADAGGGPLSPEGLEILRVENGVPALGAEAGEETLPQEAGMTDLVSFTKGCFLGQEPVARLQNRGHTNRGLAGVVLEPGAPVPAAGDGLLDGEREVGVVTSGVLSPLLGRPVALSLLRHEAAAPGTRLRLRSRGAVLSCEVVPLPFAQGGGAAS